MSRIVNRAENWEKAYEAFQQVNFAAWDYQTIKESLVDYLKLYYPEEFNDFIESSELIALIELFAYVGEQMAYRFDMNAHENFISTAQRKESVLRLAKLLSYNANRNIASRGLVKMTSISTTERVFDSNGNDLSNTTVRWNDVNNQNWKEQFILIMNRVMDQNFGTVAPTDRVQVQDVLFERYKLINNPLSTNILPYSITVSNETLPMELVSADINEFGPLETRPEKDLSLGILYLNDGLGDSSENTGFFFYTKQGVLQRTETSFDGVTPNQIFDVEISDINETDVFLNNIDSTTGYVLEDPNDTNSDVRVGEWVSVDTVGGQNVIFNSVENRNKYEIETLADDQVRLIFGDGKFTTIPSGTFEIWTRTSANSDIPIPTTALQNVGNSFTYQDAENKEQTFNITTSLLTPIQNAAPSEDIEHIRRTAPSVYYTQDRMVNGRDYNEFLLQDNTILKLRAINRTFAGDSKYIAWHDPRESYEDVKLFGDDGVMYIDIRDGDEEICQTIQGSDLPVQGDSPYTDLIDAIVDNYLQPLLSTGAFFTRFVLEGVAPTAIRIEFTSAERTTIESALVDAVDSRPTTKYFNWDGTNWAEDLTGTDYWFSIASTPDGNWEMCYEAYLIKFHSDETKFWNTNNDDSVITSDTLNTNLDSIVILNANVSAPNASPSSSILTQNYEYSVLGQTLITAGVDSGLPSINDLFVVPTDTTGDGFPDDPDLLYLFGALDVVYFYRETVNSPWVYQPDTQDVDLAAELAADTQDLWKTERGLGGLNFAWFHRTPRYNLIDPATSNLIDMYIITRGYARNIRLWLTDQVSARPEAPSSFQLRSDYQDLLESKMISDTVIMHSGSIKILFGSKANAELQGTIKIIRSSDRSLSNTQIKSSVVDAVRDFFDISLWEFGETFYFSELSAYIHSQLPSAVDSIVLVPTLNTNQFGDLYQVVSKEDEILQVDFSVDQVEIVESLDATTLRQ